MSKESQTSPKLTDTAESSIIKYSGTLQIYFEALPEPHKIALLMEEIVDSIDKELHGKVTKHYLNLYDERKDKK